ncbi:MAG: YeiH family protein [Bacillota bacterium]
MKFVQTHLPGLIFVFALALASTWLGSIFPIIGGAVFGIIFGMIISNIFGKPSNTVDGIKFSSKKILQWAIIMLGAGLNLAQVWKTGMESLYVMVFTLSFAYISAYLVGRLLKVPDNLISLIGTGTAICGGSAIAAVSPIIEAEEMEVAYSISTIFLFNVLAVLVFPPLGHLLGFSDQAFGLWAGTAINDTSSVVAAGYAFSNTAGDYATIVKLTRTTMIIPISLLFAFAVALKKRRESKDNPMVNYSLKRIFPWFIIWFLAASLLNTLGLFNDTIVHYFKLLGKFMIVMALSAIGLNADFKKMLKTGVKPMFLGMAVWFVVSIVSLIVQFSLGQI